MSIEAYKTGYIDGAANELHYKQRCEQLEHLCCDMYRALDKVAANIEALVGQPMRVLTDESVTKTRRDLNCYRDRMDALGLLEVDE